MSPVFDLDNTNKGNHPAIGEIIPAIGEITQ